MARVKITRKVAGRIDGKSFPLPGKFYDGPDDVCARLVSFGFAEVEKAPEQTEDEAAEEAETVEREAAEEAERVAHAATEAASRETATVAPTEKRGPGRPRKNAN